MHYGRGSHPLFLVRCGRVRHPLFLGWVDYWIGGTLGTEALSDVVDKRQDLCDWGGRTGGRRREQLSEFLVQFRERVRVRWREVICTSVYGCAEVLYCLDEDLIL